MPDIASYCLDILRGRHRTESFRYDFGSYLDGPHIIRLTRQIVKQTVIAQQEISSKQRAVRYRNNRYIF